MGLSLPKDRMRFPLSVRWGGRRNFVDLDHPGRWSLCWPRRETWAAETFGVRWVAIRLVLWHLVPWVVWTHADAKVLVISRLENLIHEVVGVYAWFVFGVFLLALDHSYQSCFTLCCRMAQNWTNQWQPQKKWQLMIKIICWRIWTMKLKKLFRIAWRLTTWLIVNDLKLRLRPLRSPRNWTSSGGFCRMFNALKNRKIFMKIEYVCKEFAF